MNKDSKLIFEAYQNKLEEGLFDRLKARAAGVGGTVKGIGDRIAGGVKGAYAGYQGDDEASKAAAQQGHAGKIQGDISKINSYKATAEKKIKELTSEIMNDLTKLGIDINVNYNVANGFLGNLNKGFSDLVAALQKKSSPAPAAKPTPEVKASPVTSPAVEPIKTKIVPSAKAVASTKAKAGAKLADTSKVKFRKVYK